MNPFSLRRDTSALKLLMLGLALSSGCFAATISRVFTTTNLSTGNSVLVYTRNADGSLTLAQTVATGGNGSGSVLMSQGSILAVSHYLYVVNAGSNTISILNTGGQSVKLIGSISSGGSFPLSLTFFGGRLYVVNQNQSGNIAGFTASLQTGMLTPLAGSTQLLSGAQNPGPAEISFTKSGTALIVTEKLTNKIDIYPVTNGVAGAPTSYSSNAPVPYGFTSGARARFYVTEANANVPLGSSVSSYSLPQSNVPSLISSSVSTSQSAACWIVLNTANTFAYVTDNESDALSVYSIDANGHLTLDSAFTVNTSSLGGPFDDVLSTDGAYLYVTYPGSGKIGVYKVNSDGSLTPSASAAGLNAASSGIAIT